MGAFSLMSDIPEKAVKCLNLALNSGATEGEWNAAAIRFVSILRSLKVGIECIIPKSPDTSRERKPTNRTKSADTFAKMPFGKFKGSAITDLPDWYVDWCLNQDFIKGKLRDEIEKEHKARSTF